MRDGPGDVAQSFGEVLVLRRVGCGCWWEESEQGEDGGQGVGGDGSRRERRADQGEEGSDQGGQRRKFYDRCKDRELALRLSYRDIHRADKITASTYLHSLQPSTSTRQTRPSTPPLLLERCCSFLLLLLHLSRYHLLCHPPPRSLLLIVVVVVVVVFFYRRWVLLLPYTRKREPNESSSSSLQLPSSRSREPSGRGEGPSWWNVEEGWSEASLVERELSWEGREGCDGWEGRRA